MNPTMYLEFAGVFMLAVILICSLTVKVKSMNNKWFFTSGIISMMIVNFSDAMSIHNAYYHCRTATIIFCFMAFLFTYISLLLFSFYLFGHFSEKGFYVSRGYYTVSIVVTILSIIPLIVNLFTGIYYHYDNDLVYTQGPLYIISQLFPLVCIMLSIIVTINGRKQISTRELITFIIYEVFPMTVIILNYLIRFITWTYVVPPYLVLIIFINNYSAEVVNYMEENTNQKNKLLISQIQPHFMFNTLNSIEYLYDDNPEMGKKMINNFTKYLRTNLNNLSSDQLIPFSSELDHIKTFLEIEKIRFGSRLNVVFDIHDTEFDIPTLIVQPLVENAVKHGVCKKIEGGTVTLHTSSNHNEIVIIISDDGIGFDVNEKFTNDHVGLHNIKQRLHNYFPHSKIDIQSAKGVGTKVTITIPREEYYGNINCRR